MDGLAVFLFELFPFISPEMKPEKHTIKAWVLLAPRQKPCLVHVRLPSDIRQEITQARVEIRLSEWFRFLALPRCNLPASTSSFSS